MALTGFNRYMVECESDSAFSVSVSISVLIDTWWNVNAFSTNEINSFASFNRYMVECEYQLQS